MKATKQFFIKLEASKQYFFFKKKFFWVLSSQVDPLKIIGQVSRHKSILLYSSDTQKFWTETMKFYNS